MQHDTAVQNCLCVQIVSSYCVSNRGVTLVTDGGRKAVMLSFVLPLCRLTLRGAGVKHLGLTPAVSRC